jgi:superfamily II DNA or RNA helicase
VNWDQIPLPDISIHYHRFSLDRRSKQAYDYWTEKIQSVNKLDLEPSDIDDLRLMYAIKRRRIVHLCPVRHTEVVGHYFEMVGERTLIVCEAIAQANHIAKDLGLPVYHSKNADPSILEKFQTGETPCIVSVKMLKEGFNCPAIDTIIIVSSALTEQNLVQVVGRGLRVYGDKKVAIHIFIAADTTDTKRVGLAEGILGVTQLSKDADRFPEYQWRRGTLVSIDTRGRIFKANKNGRAYYKETGLEKQITEVMGRAGRFRIYEGQVIVRDPEGRHHNLGRIELVKEEGSQSLSGNKITWEELFT